MKRAHRRAHVAIWLVLIPVVGLLVWQALDGRRTMPTEDAFPIVQEQETFK